MAAFIQLLLSVAVVIASAAANGFVLSPEDPEVLKVANYAIRTYNQMNNNVNAYKLVSIQSVSAQMYPPARVKYSLSVTAGQTVCKNRPDINLADCSLHGKTMTCNFVVLAVPNLDIPSYLLTSQCK
ncbi:cystatin 10 [Anguilla anguilla]|uniref:cystatin 10 n=1 Tax=Anguilla anguilla TaxID=7936 RepID=UPI0015AE5C91|nr:cystatin 10 [Anguilla anguilla]